MSHLENTVVKRTPKKACVVFLCVSYEGVYGTYLWWKPLIKGLGPHCGCPWSGLNILVKYVFKRARLVTGAVLIQARLQGLLNNVLCGCLKDLA